MQLCVVIFGLVAYFLLFCFLHRQWMLKHFLKAEIKANPMYQASLKRMQILGLRFDLKMVASLLAVPFLVAIGLSLFTPSAFVFAGVFSGLVFVLGLIFIAFVMGNFFYYQTYNTYYDSFIFGFVEDDTKAVLQNIFDDYPVFRAISVALLFAILPALASFYALENLQIRHSLQGVLAIFASLIFFILAIRGTLHSKPLNKLHAQVSNLNSINYLVPNGMMALVWAVKDHQKAGKFEAVSAQEGENLRAKLHLMATEKTVQNTYLEKNPPHVVFSLMESFGSNMLVLDDEKTNDMLGCLRTHTQTDFFYRRFLSFNNGTASSFLGQCFFSLNENLSQSSEQKNKMPHTAFTPYQKQGYKTVFITSGNAMWRSLSVYLSEQGIAEIYDQNSLMDIFPQAKATLSYWGVADEFAFKLAEKLLKESTTPLFIYILTVTNHPPYKAPATYQPFAVDAKVLQGRLGHGEKERRDMLTAYQYANDALGRFVSAIKESELKEKVVIGASGDHHMRGMTYNMPTELFLSYSVPFYLYVPSSIQKATNACFIKEKLASHKDIFPTLYAMSLSQGEYWDVAGRNLLAQEENSARDFAFNVSLYADAEKVVDLTQTPYVAYAWKKDLYVENPQPLDEKEEKRIQNYQAYLQWQMNFLLKGEKK